MGCETLYKDVCTRGGLNRNCAGGDNGDSGGVENREPVGDGGKPNAVGLEWNGVGFEWSAVGLELNADEGKPNADGPEPCADGDACWLGVELADENGDLMSPLIILYRSPNV